MKALAAYLAALGASILAGSLLPAAAPAPGYHPPGGMVNQPRGDAPVGGPLEMIALRSAVIAVGTAAEVGEPAAIELTIPESFQEKTKGYFRKVTLQLTQVFKSDEKKERKTLEVLVRAPEPTSEPGVPTDSIACNVGGRAPCVKIEKGKEYVVFAAKLADGQFYLPMFQESALPAGKADVARAKAVADLDTWAWGKEVGGLRMALVPATKQFERLEIPQPANDDKPAMTGVVGVQAMLALRNVSKNSINVNLHSGDRFITLLADDPAGKSVQADLWRWQARADLAPFTVKKSVVELKPGEVVVISTGGQGVMVAVAMDLTLGKWKLRATYHSERTVEGTALWAGTVESLPAEIEAIKAVPRPM